MMLDGHTTEGEVATTVLAAEREAIAKKRQTDAQRQVAMLMANWGTDATLRKSFRTFERYNGFY